MVCLLSVLEAERDDGCLCLRLLPQEPKDTKEEAKEADDEEEYGFVKFVHARRCLDKEVSTAVVSARLYKKWESVEQARATAIWVTTS
jgi:hypothetical protein